MKSKQSMLGKSIYDGFLTEHFVKSLEFYKHFCKPQVTMLSQRLLKIGMLINNFSHLLIEKFESTIGMV